MPFFKLGHSGNPQQRLGKAHSAFPLHTCQELNNGGVGAVDLQSLPSNPLKTSGGSSKPSNMKSFLSLEYCNECVLLFTLFFLFSFWSHQLVLWSTTLKAGTTPVSLTFTLCFLGLRTNQAENSS